MAKPSGRQKKEHSHDHDDLRSVSKGKLVLSLVITAVVMVLEIVGGLLTNSLALISDAGHMFTHCFAIIIALVAIVLAQRPPCEHRTYGMFRAEVLAAFVNGIFLLLVATAIIYESFMRMLEPVEVFGLEMLVVAVIGLVTNIVSIGILQGADKKDLNLRSVVYHMGADAVSSVGIVVAAVVIMYTGWSILDPLVSVAISILIVVWAIGVLKESAGILMEVAPKGMDVGTITRDLTKRFPEVERVSDAHLWTITSDMLVFSAHVSMKGVKHPEKVVAKMNRYLCRKYGILETTIQVDPPDSGGSCRFSKNC
jgi:cobalt-zinc-cadmium efflux system protein